MVDFICKDKYDFSDFRRIIALLRSEGGCPWDMEQTHESIRRNLLEESYELCQAIDENDLTNLREELGDVLMQVLFHAQIESELGNFDIDDVADAACKKLIFRHPHVFGDVTVSGSGEVLKNWEELKRIEKTQDTVTSAMDGVAQSLPALWRAEKVQDKAHKVGFDWPDVDGALEKLSEELQELREAVASGVGINEELGDLLFAAVNVSRFLSADPEDALHASTGKFIRRFKYIEDEAKLSGRQMSQMTLAEMEELYQQSKRL